LKFLVKIETIKSIEVIIIINMPRIGSSSGDLTTISLTKDTKEALNEIRKGGESWDKFFQRIAKLQFKNREE
jgi:hypothetical protein